MPKAIFFDAAGTLIRLTKSVGTNYALVAARQGLALDPAQLDRAFAAIWREMPARPATGEPREDDDKGWWRDLVERLLDRVSPRLDSIARDIFFEAAYEHFAEAGVWELYPEAREVIEILAPDFELSIVSNFDRRLRVILDRLALSKYFRHVFISSELGVDKPDPLIFRRALEISGLAPGEVWYAGDDPVRDWAAASGAGLEVFRLERPRNSLSDLVRLLL
jgi:putative hydrolase of the HAD superfamily